jgi:hypothetical protein
MVWRGGEEGRRAGEKGVCKCYFVKFLLFKIVNDFKGSVTNLDMFRFYVIFVWCEKKGYINVIEFLL